MIMHMKTNHKHFKTVYINIFCDDYADEGYGHKYDEIMHIKFTLATKEMRVWMTCHLAHSS